jgi:arsenite-transporting ATPase
MVTPMTASSSTPSIFSRTTLDSVFGTKFIFFTGKGGVGKTSIASASAVALAEQGKRVLLVSTDPASNLDETFGVKLNNRPREVPHVPRLMALNINPDLAAEEYRSRVIAPMLGTATDVEIAGLREQLSGACTVEVAVFHAFARTVFEARRSIVILDTAPTGHTLLLLDAAGSYHREMLKKFEESTPGKVKTPLMLLQDAKQSKVLLVTLAETTPVSEAAALQKDLRRASIEPYGWVVNRSLSASATTDSLLRKRAAHEQKELQRIANGLAQRLAILPLMTQEPVGVRLLEKLLGIRSASL